MLGWEAFRRERVRISPQLPCGGGKSANEVPFGDRLEPRWQRLCWYENV
jgi:hypothetical protein